LQLVNGSNAEYYRYGITNGKEFATKYYACHRSGLFVEKVAPGYTRKRKLKSQGSCKLNFNCTSTITCKIFTNNEHHIEFVKTHYGHECEIQHLKLSKCNTVQIASKLAAGVSKQR